MASGGALREVFAIFGVEVDPEGKLEKGHKDVSGLKHAFEGAVAAFAGNELLHATREFGEQLGTIQDLSEQTGITTDKIQELGFAAQMTGADVGDMNSALLLTTKAMARTDSATSPQVDALKALGIAYKDASGQPKKLNEVLPQIFENFHTLKSEAEEAAVATAFFGRGGVKLLPTLREGAAGLEEYAAQLAELGGPVPAETIAKAEEMNHAFVKMDRAFFALKGTIGAQVFPQIEKLITGIGKGVAKIGDFTKGTTLAESGSIALGIAVAGPLMKALGPLLKPGLKFAALFLAFDDAVAFLQGKDSVIGAILNGFFGPDTAAGVRAWTNGVIKDFGELFASGTSIFHALGGAWGSTLNDMFIMVSKWVLGVENAWNNLVPAALQIDTSDAEARLAEFKKIQTGYELEAFDALNPGQAKQREDDKQRLFDESHGTGRRDTKLTRADIRGAFGPQAPAAPARPDVATAFGLPRVDMPKVFAPPTSTAGAFAPVPQQQPTSFFAPLPQAPAQKVENHIDARTTVHATTNASAKDIADAVAGKQKDSLRNAYDSLTARSSAPAG